MAASTSHMEVSSEGAIPTAAAAVDVRAHALAEWAGTADDAPLESGAPDEPGGAHAPLVAEPLLATRYVWMVPLAGTEPEAWSCTAGGRGSRTLLDVVETGAGMALEHIALGE